MLARAGIIPEDDAGDEVDRDVDSDEDVEMDEDSGSEGSEDEFYRQVKQQRAEKLAAKAEIYSRFVFDCISVSLVAAFVCSCVQVKILIIAFRYTPGNMCSLCFSSAETQQPVLLCLKPQMGNARLLIR